MTASSLQAKKPFIYMFNWAWLQHGKIENEKQSDKWKPKHPKQLQLQRKQGALLCFKSEMAKCIKCSKMVPLPFFKSTRDLKQNYKLQPQLHLLSACWCTCDTSNAVRSALINLCIASAHRASSPLGPCMTTTCCLARTTRRSCS